MASEDIGLPPQGLDPQLVFQEPANNTNNLGFRCATGVPSAGDPGPKATRDLTSLYFQPQRTLDFRRNVYDSASAPDHRTIQNWNRNGRDSTSPSGDESDGDEEDEDEDDEDEDEEDEGDDVPRLENNSRTTSGHSVEKIGNGKLNHISSFGSNRGEIVMKEAITITMPSGNDTNDARASNSSENHQQGRVSQYQNAITIADQDGELYYSQYLQGSEASAAGHKDMLVENVCGFSGRKDFSYSCDAGDSLRAILSDPLTGSKMLGHSRTGPDTPINVDRGLSCCMCTVENDTDEVAVKFNHVFVMHVLVTNGVTSSVPRITASLSDRGALMDDAMILPCGHSFGAGGMQHVINMKACCTCSQPVSEGSVAPNLSLRSAVQAFRREEESQVNRASKRRRERFDQGKSSYGDSTLIDHQRGRGVQFPFVVTDRVIIKGNKRTPQRFVGREAVVTTQCLNGWYVVKTLDNAESVKLQYRSLAKVGDRQSNNVKTSFESADKTYLQPGKHII